MSSETVPSETVPGEAVPGEIVPGEIVPGEAVPGETLFVESLPDLIDASEYEADPDGRLVRVRITVTDGGVEILGDAFRPAAIEALLTALGGGPTEQMLCG